MGESTLHVDNGALERQSLTLVHRDCPCQTEGDLLVSAVHHLLNFVGLFVEREAAVLPSFHAHFYLFCRIVGTHRHRVVGNVGDFAQHTIIIAVFARTIVFDEHHLRSTFEGQHLGSGIGALRESAFDRGSKIFLTRCQLRHLLCIDVVGLVIVSHESHIGGSRSLEIGQVARIEQLERAVVCPIITNGVEEC